MSKKLGILGTGDVGRTLGAAFVKKGYEVLLGGREKTNEAAAKWASEVGKGAHYGTFEDAAKFGDMVFLCTKWEGTENALKLANPESFKGKVVVDVTNPLGFGPSGPYLVIGHNTSGGEKVQEWLPDSHVVKSLNTLNCHLMVDPALPIAPTMWIAGNDEGAKKKVTEFLHQMGWTDVIDTREGIKGARLLEPLAMLWIDYGVKNNSWANHAFKLIHQ